VPVSNWLTAEQGNHLLSTADSLSIRGKRHCAALAILLDCGLHRAELTVLRVEDIQQREEHRVFADLVGKGAGGASLGVVPAVLSPTPGLLYAGAHVE
jgi:site-specific recombinase XerD